MRIIPVTHRDTASDMRELLANMHRLRRRVFRDRLNWDVSVSGDMEVDAFDALSPTYLIAVIGDNEVTGCARLLPTTGPTMLARTFPVLLGENHPPCSPKIFESSRFCVDTRLTEEVGAGGFRKATLSLLAGVIEWGMSRDQEAVVTVTDVRFERILKRVGWPLERFGPPIQIGSTKALAGRLPISPSALECVCRAGQVRSPVLLHASRQPAVA